MRFLQDNLFYVVLVVATGILCGGLLVLASGYNEDFENELDKRRTLYRNITSRQRSEPVNEAIIDRTRKNISLVMKDVRDAETMNVTWASDNFEIPVLALPNKKKIPVLPYNRKLWSENQSYLSNKFVSYYTNRLQGLLTPGGELKMLKPVPLPTAEEIEEEKQEQLKKLIRIQRMQGAAGGETPAVKDERKERKSLEEQAQQWAVSTVRLQKARAGVIYADYASLSPLYDTEAVVNRLSPGQVWRMNLDLWIKEEVVGAISDTIKDVIKERKLPATERHVINSPIKRLFSIKLISFGGSTGRGAERASETRMPRGRGVTAGRGGLRDGRPGESRYAGPDERESPPVTRAATLTGDVSNTVYDIADYSFTVLMPLRYLNILQENLVDDNYHVVTRLDVKPAFPKTMKTAEVSDKAEGLYYYGTEALRQITVRAQLRMMTVWTRGEAEEGEDGDLRWVRKPLMPPEVIRTLPASALREIDRKDPSSIKGF